MEGDTTYTAADLPEWEARLASAMAQPPARADEWTGTVPSPHPGIGREARRIRLAVDALRIGLSVRHVFDGLLLDDVLVLATSTNKWRFARQDMRWHRYGSVDEVFAVAKGGLLHDAHGRVPAMPEIQARLRRLLESMGMDRDSYPLPAEPEAAWTAVRKLGIEHERIKAGGTLPPTKPQLQTARILANALGIAMPELPTRDAANRFIDAHDAHFTDAPPNARPKGRGPKAGEDREGRRKAMPNYARLKRVQVPAPALLALGVSSVDHLVARVNAIRELADRPYVSRPRFPSGLANFRALAGELLAATRDPTDTSVPGQDSASLTDVWFVTAENERTGNARTYDPSRPLIDFVIENLDLLPAKQRIAVDRRLYVTGAWKGLGPLARELSVSSTDAETLLDIGFHALGDVTGCWKAVSEAILSSGGRTPIKFPEIGGQPWAAGMPDDAVLAVAERATGLRLAHVEGHGDYLLRLKDGEIARFTAAMSSAYPRLRWQKDADALLKDFRDMFGGRIEDAVRHMLGYEISDWDGTP